MSKKSQKLDLITGDAITPRKKNTPIHVSLAKQIYKHQNKAFHHQQPNKNKQREVQKN